MSQRRARRRGRTAPAAAAAATVFSATAAGLALRRGVGAALLCLLASPLPYLAGTTRSTIDAEGPVGERR